MLTTELEDNSFALYIGAFTNGLLIGYVGSWKIGEEAHLTNLAVHPDHRRRGIAKALLEKLMDWARNAGVVSMTLEVRESNEIARNLYRSMGFFDAGRRRRYYSDNGEDAVIMWRRESDCQSPNE